MDLAIKFNDIGCVYYQEGCTEHAYDLFCGAMQALHHSAAANHCTLDEMDAMGRQMLLIDPSIQRAFDKIHCTPGTHCGAHHVTTNPGACSHDISPPTTTAPPHKSNDIITRRPSTATTTPARPLRVTTAQQMNNATTTTTTANGSRSAQPPHRRTTTMDDEYVFEWKRVFTVDGLQHYNYPPAVHASVLSAGILFNQAMVLHTGGVPTGRRALERSLTLYSMAAKRLFDGCPRYLLTADEYTTTLTCAVLNNTGYLLHQMGEYGGSQLCFTRMTEFLHLLGPSHSVHEKRRRDEFGLNVLIFWRPLSGAAAA